MKIKKFGIKDWIVKTILGHHIRIVKCDLLLQAD